MVLARSLYACGADVDAPGGFQAKLRIAHEADELSGRASHIQQRLATQLGWLDLEIREGEPLVALIAGIAALGQIDRGLGFGGGVACVELLDLMRGWIGGVLETA